MTTVTALPIPPSRQDPFNFSTRADEFLGALPTFGTELNLVAGEVNTNASNASTAASTATTQAGIATTKASEALTSANNAANSVVAASNWATLTSGPVSGGEYSAKYYAQQAAVSVESYQGGLPSDPTLDKNGNPLSAGDWYINTTTGFIRAYTGSVWGQGISAVAGVSSFNGQTGNVVYQVPQLTTPTNVSPASETIDVNPGFVLTASKSKSIYGTEVETKFQISTSSDFTTGVVETAWLTSSTDTVSYVLEPQDISEGTITHHWRVVCRTVVNSTTYTSDPSTAFNFVIKAVFFDVATDVDGLGSLVTIQADYNPSVTYSIGQVVIVRSNGLSFKEYKSLQNSNTGNSPESSPAFWELVYDNNLNTSGYFGEVPGNKCVIDKGEWSSTTSYSIGDMVVKRKIATPLTQNDLLAYVAKTANTNKDPATNPSDWEQRNGLPTGTSLAQTLGIGNATPEVLINNDSGWLKFAHNGKIKYIAKKPFMHTVSWNDIAKAEAVYGNRTVRIGSRLFRVSLLSGAEADPSSWITTSTASDNKGAGSEWNELIYRVHADVPTSGTTTSHGGAQIGSNWHNFNDADMTMTSASGNGSYTWCRETVASSTADRVVRGASLSSFSYGTSSLAGTNLGWRPCLTLISDEELEGSLYKAEATGVGPSVASLQYDPITDTGYYGEVSSAQFYTGTQISTATGVTSGTLQNDTEGWLKFYWHGQVLFIAKKTYRYGLSWDNINSANAVYGVNLGSTGKKTITHASGTKYDVKLMKGATKDPSPASSPGRQWNELLYRVCTGTETGEIGANWATLNPSTYLGINSGNGSYSWTQEVYQPNTAGRVGRGAGSLSRFTYDTSSATDALVGWRPCLALVR